MQRALARLLMGRGHLNIITKEGELVLPRGSARTVARDATLLTMSARIVRVNTSPVVNIKAGRIDASAKRDGPKSFFISPLHKMLTEVAEVIRAKGRAKGQLPADHLVVAVHRSTPWRAAAEALYTARKAEYKRFQLVVRSSSIWDRALLFGVITSSEVPATEPKVRFSRESYTLTLGGLSMPQVYPATHGERAASLKALAGFVHRPAQKST
jgi:hypothetical protein